MMENLELDDEEKQFLEAEHDEVQEVPVSTKNPKKKKRRKFSAKKRHSSQKRKNKFTIELVEIFQFLKNFCDCAKNYQLVDHK